MNDALALVFDVGTQSVRAMLFDAAGHIVRSAQDIYEQPYYSRNPNWAEQRPDFYFEHICIVSQRLKDQSPEDFARAASVAVTVFRDTTVCMGKDGRPLRDCILWMDQRRAENPKPLPAERRAIFALAGMTETVEMLHRTSACNWIAENEPELWKKTDKYVCLSTYLNYRFTGRIADSSASLMAKIPYDYKNRKWDKNGLTRCVYDIPQDKLCEILPSGSVVGGVTPEASRLTGIPAGLPMLATGSDKGCETIGLSVIREDQAALSFGTSCTVQFTTRKYFEPTPFMPAYPAVPNDMYNPEIQILRGYWMLTWFKQNFAQAEVEAAKALGCSAEEILNKHLGDPRRERRSARAAALDAGPLHAEHARRDDRLYRPPHEIPHVPRHHRGSELCPHGRHVRHGAPLGAEDPPSLSRRRRQPQRRDLPDHGEYVRPSGLPHPDARILRARRGHLLVCIAREIYLL